MRGPAVDAAPAAPVCTTLVAACPAALPFMVRWFYFRLSNAANASVTLRLVDVNNATAGGGANTHIPGGGGGEEAGATQRRRPRLQLRTQRSGFCGARGAGRLPCHWRRHAAPPPPRPLPTGAAPLPAPRRGHQH